MQWIKTNEGEIKRLKSLLLLSLSHYGDKAQLTPPNIAVNHRLLAGKSCNKSFLWFCLAWKLLPEKSHPLLPSTRQKPFNHKHLGRTTEFFFSLVCCYIMERCCKTVTKHKGNVFPFVTSEIYRKSFQPTLQQEFLRKASVLNPTESCHLAPRTQPVVLRRRVLSSNSCSVCKRQRLTSTSQHAADTRHFGGVEEVIAFRWGG